MISMRQPYLYLGVIAPDLLQFAIYQNRTITCLGLALLLKAVYTLLSLYLARKSFLLQQLFSVFNIVLDFWLYLMGVIAIVLYSTVEAWKECSNSANSYHRGCQPRIDESDTSSAKTDRSSNIRRPASSRSPDLSNILGAKYIPAFIELAWLSMGICASAHLLWPYNLYALIIFFIQGFRYKSRFIKNELCWTPRVRKQ